MSASKPRSTTDKLKAERVQAPLKAERVQSRLRRLTGWELVEKGKAIRRTYGLPDFRSAIAFVNYVAELAETKGHHPDIRIRYNTVTLSLTSYKVGGVTEQDLELAATIDGGGT